MVFSSESFLFLFLPVVLILYFCLGKRIRNLILFVFSLAFYYWGEQELVLLLLLSVVVNFLLGIWIEKNKNSGGKKHKSSTLTLVLSILYNLGLLVYFKYSNFFIDNISDGLHTAISFPAIALPIGISFYTFQAISYIVDVYRDDVPASRNIIDFGCYLTFFPQLIAGPIIRYIDVSKQLKYRKIHIAGFAYGVERFIIGLGKKVLIANTLGRSADIIFSSPIDDMGALIYWLGAVLYGLQIYFDFSGYSDMAIGLGRIFGFKFLENFNYPYIAKSIRDFWRRWHISLSTWFRDYLYVPLGGNRHSQLRLYFNLFIVFVLCGFWHGASWSFVVWGIFHGVFIVFERIGFGKVLKKLPASIAHIYTLFIVLISWVIFRAENFSSGLEYFEHMFDFSNIYNIPIRMVLERDTIAFLIIGLIFSTPIKIKFKMLFNNAEALRKTFAFLKFGFLMLILTYSILKMSSGSFNPFLYFRF